ncbi:MAG: flavodoxin family protein [Promethearchaeota archaeon]
MKALVTYFSQTGNTKEIAEAIHESLSTRIEARIATMRAVDCENLQDYDILFVGAPCHDSDLARPVKGFLERLPESPGFKLVGFFTHATYMPAGDERWKDLYDHWAGLCLPSFEKGCKDKNIEFLGHFHCQGRASEPIENFIHQEIVTDEDEWNEYLPELRKHPDEADIQNAKEFALKLIADL